MDNNVPINFPPKPKPEPAGDVFEADDNWARVELFRWQYGELCKGDDNRKLNVRIGFTMMTQALENAVKNGDMSKAPDPMNLIIVMKYVAKFLST